MGNVHVPGTLTCLAALSASLLCSACSHSERGPVEPRGSIDAGAAQPATGMGAAPGAQPATSTPALERDPEAIRALNRMGEHLRAQREFVVRADITTDEVLETGQKLQFESNVELSVRRPDKLKAKIRSDRKDREIYFDGRTFTLYGKRVGYYAQTAAPPTILQMIREVQDRLGIEVPLVDLFYWGTPESDEQAIQGAIDVGPARVRGVDTEQYAFRLPDVDFQVWIEKGERPLPRKLVITTRTEQAEPQHAMVLTWDLAPKLADSDFKFVPPEGAHRIAFEENTP